MEPAKKYSIKPVDTTHIDLFIRELAEETGVSVAFIEAARPMIEKAFLEVSPENRDICLDQIRDIVRGQSETEAHIARAREAASKLEDAQLKYISSLDEIKKRSTQIRSAYNGVSFSMTNAFSDRPLKIIKA